MSDNTAKLAGYTRPLVAHTPDGDRYLWARPEAYTDQPFSAYDRDACEFILAQGQTWEVVQGEP